MDASVAPQDNIASRGGMPPPQWLYDQPHASQWQPADEYGFTLVHDASSSRWNSNPGFSRGCVMGFFLFLGVGLWWSLSTSSTALPSAEDRLWSTMAPLSADIPSYGGSQAPLPGFPDVNVEPVYHQPYPDTWYASPSPPPTTSTSTHLVTSSFLQASATSIPTALPSADPSAAGTVVLGVFMVALAQWLTAGITWCLMTSMAWAWPCGSLAMCCCSYRLGAVGFSCFWPGRSESCPIERPPVLQDADLCILSGKLIGFPYAALYGPDHREYMKWISDRSTGPARTIVGDRPGMRAVLSYIQWRRDHAAAANLPASKR